MSLEAENLSVRFGPRPVLQGVSAAFEPGQVTAVVGPNGAGKSTLLACLAGLRAPDAGSVLLDGEDVARMAPRSRARRIGFLPQVPEVAWAVEVETLVGLGRIPFIGARGLGDEDRAAVAEAMAATGVEPLAGRIVGSLSGGERARVLIARVLAGRPAWVLADEPMAGLDPGHALDAGRLFRRLAETKGCGVVLTLHDLSAALRFADKVLVLADGGVIAHGTPAEALSPASIAAAYGVEARVIEGVGGPMLEIVGRLD